MEKDLNEILIGAEQLFAIQNGEAEYHDTEEEEE